MTLKGGRGKVLHTPSSALQRNCSMSSHPRRASSSMPSNFKPSPHHSDAPELRPCIAPAPQFSQGSAVAALMGPGAVRTPLWFAPLAKTFAYSRSMVIPVDVAIPAAYSGDVPISDGKDSHSVMNDLARGDRRELRVHARQRIRANLVEHGTVICDSGSTRSARAHRPQ